jgi:hypothetical protein
MVLPWVCGANLYSLVVEVELYLLLLLGLAAIVPVASSPGVVALASSSVASSSLVVRGSASVVVAVHGRIRSGCMLAVAVGQSILVPVQCHVPPW